MSGNTEDTSLGDFDASIEKLRSLYRDTQLENTRVNEELARVTKTQEKNNENATKELKEENQQLKDENEQLKEENERFKSETERRKEDCNRMKKLVEDQEETVKTLLDENSALKQEKEKQSESRDLAQDIQSKQDEIDSLQEAKEKLVKETDELRKKLEASEEKLARVSQEKQNLEKRHATTLQNVDVMKKQNEEEMKKLQNQVRMLNERVASTKTKLKEQEDQNLGMRKWMKTMERENNDLKNQNVALQKQKGGTEAVAEVKAPEKKVGALSKGLAIGSMDVVVPQHQYEDRRIQSPLKQLCEDMLGRTIIAMVAASIGPECEHQLVVTCIPNHKEIEIDLRQALDGAKLGLLCPVVIVLHHLAPHRASRIVPQESARRLQTSAGASGGGGSGGSGGPAALTRRYRAIVDLVYWQGNILECDVNTEGVRMLEELLRVPVEDDTTIDRQLAPPSSSSTAASATTPTQPPPSTTS